MPNIVLLLLCKYCCTLNIFYLCFVVNPKTTASALGNYDGHFSHFIDLTTN